MYVEQALFLRALGCHSLLASRKNRHIHAVLKARHSEYEIEQSVNIIVN